MPACCPPPGRRAQQPCPAVPGHRSLAEATAQPALRCGLRPERQPRPRPAVPGLRLQDRCAELPARPHGGPGRATGVTKPRGAHRPARAAGAPPLRAPRGLTRCGNRPRRARAPPGSPRLRGHRPPRTGTGPGLQARDTVSAASPLGAATSRGADFRAARPARVPKEAGSVPGGFEGARRTAAPGDDGGVLTAPRECQPLALQRPRGLRPVTQEGLSACSGHV